MAFFVELTEGDAAYSKKNIFDAAKIVAATPKGYDEGIDLLVDDGDYQSGGKTVHVQETIWEFLRMTIDRVNFVQLTEVNHKEEGSFFTPATDTMTSYFNAAAVTKLIPSRAPLPGTLEPWEGASTVIKLSSGKNAHVQEEPLIVARAVNQANRPR